MNTYIISDILILFLFIIIAIYIFQPKKIVYKFIHFKHWLIFYLEQTMIEITFHFKYIIKPCNKNYFYYIATSCNNVVKAMYVQTSSFEDIYTYSDKITNEVIDIIMMRYGVYIFNNISKFEFNRLNNREKRIFLNSFKEIKNDRIFFECNSVFITINRMSQLNGKGFIFNLEKDRVGFSTFTVEYNRIDFDLWLKEYGIKDILLFQIFDNSSELFYGIKCDFENLDIDKKNILKSNENFKFLDYIELVFYTFNSKIKLINPKYTIFNKQNNVIVYIVELP